MKFQTEIQPQFCPNCGEKSYYTIQKLSECRLCNYAIYQNVAAAVAAIIEFDGKILVATRRNEPAAGAPDLPGGFVDPFETAEQALARELREELKAELKSARFLCTQHNRYPYRGIVYHTVDLFFICQILEPELISANDDVSAIQWYALADVRPEMFPFESMQAGIAAYLAFRQAQNLFEIGG